MELHDGFNSIAEFRVSPDGIGQTPCVEVGIDRYVVAEALGGTEQRLQLDLLNMPFNA